MLISSIPVNVQNPTIPSDHFECLVWWEGTKLWNKRDSAQKSLLGWQRVILTILRTIQPRSQLGVQFAEKGRTSDLDGLTMAQRTWAPPLATYWAQDDAQISQRKFLYHTFTVFQLNTLHLLCCHPEQCRENLHVNFVLTIVNGDYYCLQVRKVRQTESSVNPPHQLLEVLCLKSELPINTGPVLCQMTRIK